MKPSKKIRAVLIAGLVFASIVASNLVFAAQVKLVNPLGDKISTIPELVNSIIRAILGMVGALALFMFVYGGVMWMTSAGNSQRIDKGRETLVWATIGLVIIFASYAILSFIFQALSGQS